MSRTRLLRKAGVHAVTVDVSTRTPAPDADLGAEAVAAFHPDGPDAVLKAGDRGLAVTAMSEALKHCIAARGDVGSMIGLGGSGGTAIITPAMRALPIGVPKLIRWLGSLSAPRPDCVAGAAGGTMPSPTSSCVP